MNFSDTLTVWYAENARNLPWRETKDPYKIWLSEVILQQTRVQQGMPYYLSFLKAYPTVQDLAHASEQEVLKRWQGLGYYSRARNMLKAARMVVEAYDGVFPHTYSELIKLKGVGDYTASAVASFCFDEPVAVLDGNVFRVLARYYGWEAPINTPAGKKLFKQKADEVLDKDRPGLHNQAIMEFGALQCKPRSPDCQACPLRDSCTAFQLGKVAQLPVKLKKVKVKKRHLNYLVFQSGEKNLLIQKRVKKGIWKNLFEFPVLETAQNITVSQLKEQSDWLQLGEDREYAIQRFYPKVVKHQLSHQTLFIQFWVIAIDQGFFSELPLDTTHQVVSSKEIKTFPVPVVIQYFLEEFL